jgi:hypothetical protein
MAVRVSESYTSRPFTIGLQSQRELTFDVFCDSIADDETAVYNAVNAVVPTVYQGLVIDTIQCELNGSDILWKARVLYKRLANETEYTFDTSGGTQKITQSLATTRYGSSYSGAPDFQGAIGVSEDKVEGVDITVPQFTFSETHFFSDGTITAGFKSVLYNMTGKVNNASFKGTAAGETLFLGASGSRRPGDLQWPITFRFASNPNQASLTVGSISGIAKGGWQYLWVRYADFQDSINFALVKRPVAAYVETVYYAGDFSLLLIGV